MFLITDSPRGQSLSFEELMKVSPEPDAFLSCLVIPEISALEESFLQGVFWI